MRACPHETPDACTRLSTRGVNYISVRDPIFASDKVHQLLRRDVLCSDKTGTLTMDEVVLVRHLDAASKDSLDCLKLGYANSYFQVRGCLYK